MFNFWKKKNSVNQVALANVLFNKTENIYSLSNYFNMETRKKTYGINTVVKNVPMYFDNGKVFVKIKYIGIPDTIVYFVLKLSNVQNEYVSCKNTVDIIINASLKGEECKNSKFELIPIYDKRRAISCK